MPSDPVCPPLALQGLLSTALELTQLEKIEFGGVRGKALGQQVLGMYEEFQEGFQVFSERTYDCLDLANQVGGSSLGRASSKSSFPGSCSLCNRALVPPPSSFPPLGI